MAEVRLDVMKMFPNILDKRTAKQLTVAMRDGSIDALKKGLSPVKSKGRLQRYKNPARYPGNRKPRKPVNLKLTGALWKSLWFKFIRNNKFIYGTLRGNVDAYADVHNEGLHTSPRRPYIPSRKGEKFIVTIQNEMRKIVSKRIDVLIKKSSR